MALTSNKKENKGSVHEHRMLESEPFAFFLSPLFSLSLSLWSVRLVRLRAIIFLRTTGETHMREEKSERERKEVEGPILSISSIWHVSTHK